VSFLYRLIDELGNNRVFSFIYKKYINQIGLEGNETVLDFGSGSGAGSRHLAKIAMDFTETVPACPKVHIVRFIKNSK
jgi:ubiquinone/menaquinone biosynthesis C-methylase UbiE